MYLFLFRVRARSPEAVDDVCRVFAHSLSLFQEPGWIGGHCVVNLEDPCDVLIDEMWGSLPAMQAWLGSEARQEAHRQLVPYVEGPPREFMFREVD